MSQNRIAEEEAETWPRDINHQWHNKEELKTTTCYLTLAKQFAPPKTYVAGEIEVDLGGAELESTQAIPVKLQPSKDKAKASKRFGRAMNILDIKTYVHASQRTSITMPVYGESSIDAEQQNKHSSASMYCPHGSLCPVNSDLSNSPKDQMASAGTPRQESRNYSVPVVFAAAYSGRQSYCCSYFVAFTSRPHVLVVTLL